MSFDSNEVDNLTLPEIPDLSGMIEDRPAAWEDGWYDAIVLESQTVTSRTTGAVTTFTSEDRISKAGDSRNLFLRVQIKRRKDGRTLVTRAKCINYRPSDFTPERVAAVIEGKTRAKEEGSWSDTDLRRSFLSMLRIGSLQRIAGVKQFQHTPEGGLDLTPLFGKPGFARLADDDQGKYKEAAEINDTVGPKTKVL
jgi:hypothetical protein